jgi:ArsR family transcriptional regulator, lead/cadmium/zinc/bismuth-responsive transcriptional repressor
VARTDTDPVSRTDQLEADPQEQARDILAQWRSHTLARQPNSQTGPEDAIRMAEVFKVLSDPTRVNMIQALVRGEEMCVGDLARKVQMSQSSVSHHLRILRHFHLVRTSRTGREILYTPDDDHVKTLLRVCLEHVRDG